MDVDNLGSLYQQYANGLRIAHIAHFEAARVFVLRDRALGIGSVVLSTIVGSSLFATVNQSPAVSWRLIAGVASLVAAVLAALSTFLRYEQLADRHHAAAVRYGGLRREFETLVSTADDLISVRAKVGDIVARWNEADESAPPIPGRVHARTMNRVLASPSIRPTGTGHAGRGEQEAVGGTG
ncbi:SLATT domain-containing protein [Micromonospora chersina]|uniref:SLATT domain-containing protein n=1 Tax=Micromonospora chersina TaxID=47854 RepID=UPI003CADDFE9